ncbi:MAG: energy-coupling factor transporter ATPase [Lachnospiraceae bacterium]|nr:energy-coupling factor transporter ATPase [Lachnospiraceae bacterium]
MSLIVNHVSYYYNKNTVMETKALDDISFTVSDGEFIGLIGHTGCGKSTLVQHLNGLLKVQEGEICYNGENISDSDFDMRKLRSLVGLVFQYPEHQLFEEDVFSDVCFGPRNLGLSDAEVELRAYEALKQVGVKDEHFYQSPFDLSGGEKRRVAIAGVLAMHPEVLVLDEPTAGLDPRGRQEILKLISDLHEKNGITIILVSHSMDDVAEYANRLLVMHEGRLVYDDTPRNVFANEAELEAMGLSVPEVTKIMHMLKDAGVPVRQNVITIEEGLRACLEILR